MRIGGVGALITLLVMTSAAVVAAADDVVDEAFSDFSLLDLEALLNTEVEVGGGKQRISDVPAVVDVLTRDRIDALGIRDMNELMAHFTGVYIQRSNLWPMLQNQTLFRMGSVNDRILFLVDDHAQLDELDELSNPFSIPIDAIERVEFLRGPAAVLYGSSSMAGVVKIVTRKPNESGGGGTVIFEALGPAGEVDAWGAYVHPDDPDRLRVRSDIQARQTEDSRIFYKADGDIPPQSGSFPQQVSYISHLTTIRSHGLYVRVQNHLMQSRVMGLTPLLSWRTEQSDFQLHGGEVGYRHTFGDWDVGARYALDYRSRDIDVGRLPGVDGFFGPPFALAEDQQTEMRFDGIVGEAEADAHLRRDRYGVEVGLQHRYLRTLKSGFFFENGTPNSLSDVDGADAAVHDGNLFGQVTYTPLDPLTLIAGARLNVYKLEARGDTGFITGDTSPSAEFSPMARAAVVWRALDELTIKAMYGRSFRLPTLVESFSQVDTVFSPNLELDPEVMDTIELAFEARPTASLFVRLNGFYNFGRDSIEFAQSNDIVVGGRFRNNSNGFVARGVETNFDWYSTTWLNLFGSGVFQEGFDGDDRNRVINRDPRVVINGGAVVKPFGDPTLTLSPFFWHHGRVHSRDSGSTVVNFTARYSPLEWLTVSASLLNVFDENFVQPVFVGVNAPPVIGFMRDSRALRLGVSAHF